jgi:RNA polymerase sigma-54 factor
VTWAPVGRAPGPGAPGRQRSRPRAGAGTVPGRDREREPDQDFDSSGEAGEWMANVAGRNGQRDDDDDATSRSSRRPSRRCATTWTPGGPDAPVRPGPGPGALPDRGTRRRRLPQPGPRRSPAPAAQELEVELDDLNIALRQIQSLDPAGIGATDVGQCLALQLRTLPPSEVRQLALAIVAEHLELLAARNFLKLKRAPALQRRCPARSPQPDPAGSIPGPGAQFSQADTRYVVPDVVVRKVRNAWTVASTPTPCRGCASTSLYAQILRRQPRCQRLPVQPPAGGPLADQERAAALRHHPARLASDR